MSKNDSLINELDRKFANYHAYNKEIAIRKEELKLREVDENIGGGRSNIMSNPIESQVIKEMSDPYIMKHGYASTPIYRIRQKVLLDFGRKIGEIN